MPNTPTTSFIPKQGPVRRVRQTANRQVHLFAVISYVVFVASLLGAVGVFLFERYVGKHLENEVNALNEEIKGFSDADMERVREFNARLLMAEDRLTKSVSMVSVFEALEDAAVKSVSLEQLSLKKENDESITLTTTLLTDTFDSSLFQRGMYERNDIIETVSIGELDITSATEEGSVESGVTMTATLVVPTDAVPVVAPEPAAVTEVVSVPEEVLPATSTIDSLETTTELVPANNESI